MAIEYLRGGIFLFVGDEGHFDSLVSRGYYSPVPDYEIPYDLRLEIQDRLDARGVKGSSARQSTGTNEAGKNCWAPNKPCGKACRVNCKSDKAATGTGVAATKTKKAAAKKQVSEALAKKKGAKAAAEKPAKKVSPKQAERQVSNLMGQGYFEHKGKKYLLEDYFSDDDGMPIVQTVDDRGRPTSFPYSEITIPSGRSQKAAGKAIKGIADQRSKARERLQSTYRFRTNEYGRPRDMTPEEKAEQEQAIKDFQSIESLWQNAVSPRGAKSSSPIAHAPKASTPKVSTPKAAKKVSPEKAQRQVYDLMGEGHFEHKGKKYPLQDYHISDEDGMPIVYSVDEEGRPVYFKYADIKIPPKPRKSRKDSLEELANDPEFADIMRRRRDSRYDSPGFVPYYAQTGLPCLVDPFHAFR